MELQPALEGVMSKCEWDELAASYRRLWRTMSYEEQQRERHLGVRATAENELKRCSLVTLGLKGLSDGLTPTDPAGPATPS